MYIEDYFDREKAGAPYMSASENLADHITLAVQLVDMAVYWRRECDEEEYITPAGIRISADIEKSISRLEKAIYEERTEPLFVPEMRDVIRDGLSYI